MSQPTETARLGKEELSMLKNAVVRRHGKLRGALVHEINEALRERAAWLDRGVQKK